MFDSQKITFNDFCLGFKHGIYVFTEDACHICHDYQKSIEHINNANLYFVEVNTKEQKDVVKKITNRLAFPMTACFKDNELEYVRVGQLFELQLQEIYESLKEFGDAPLPKEEIERRINAINTRCKLTYYIMPPECNFATRMRLMEHGIKYNELPIDVDMLVPRLPLEQRVHMLEGNYTFADLVIYKYTDTNIFSDLGQKVLIGYTAKNKDAKFTVRMIEEELDEDINATNSSNN